MAPEARVVRWDGTFFQIILPKGFPKHMIVVVCLGLLKTPVEVHQDHDQQSVHQDHDHDHSLQ